jgi:hypothetical protein
VGEKVSTSQTGLFRGAIFNEATLIALS